MLGVRDAREGGDGMTHGEAIRSARVRLGLTQRALAREVGCSHVYLGNAERGACRLSVKHATKAESVLGLAAGALSVRETLREACITEGRREMLWLMAVGAAWSRALTDDYERSSVAYEVQWFAMCALSNMGDERAREMLR